MVRTKINPMECDGDVELIWAASLLHEKIDDPIDFKSSENKHTYYGTAIFIITSTSLCWRRDEDR